MICRCAVPALRANNELQNGARRSRRQCDARRARSALASDAPPLQARRAGADTSYFAIGVVSGMSLVSTTNTASNLAGFVLLALALTPWWSPGLSEKLCPVL